MANIIRKSNVTQFVNCWKVELKGNFYAILPAHVAIYKKDNIWHKSHFLNMCTETLLKEQKNVSWHIPTKFITNLNLENDFAWAHISKPSYYFKSIEYCFHEHIEGNFYFNQPFDYENKLQSNAILGKISGTLYNSPNSDLFECLNVGFKGMSGAICLDNNHRMIGLFARRGQDLGMATCSLTQLSIDKIDQSNLDKDIAKSVMTMSRAIIIPPSIMLKHINSKENINVDSLSI